MPQEAIYHYCFVHTGDICTNYIIFYLLVCVYCENDKTTNDEAPIHRERQALN